MSEEQVEVNVQNIMTCGLWTTTTAHSFENTFIRKRWSMGG